VSGMATDTLLETVRRFVDDEALPAVARYDRDDAYPERRYVTPTQPMSGVFLYLVALMIVVVAIGVIVATR